MELINYRNLVCEELQYLLMEVDGVVCVIRICGKIFESVVCLMDVKEMILEVIYLKMKEKCCIYDSVCKGGWMNVC